MNSKVIVLLLLGMSCGTVAPPCGPSTCSGCCDGSGQCRTSGSSSTCGIGGAACQQYDGDELERCSMNGRTLSGFADELIITTEKGAIVGLRFPGLGAAKSGWPDSDGIEGTRRWR